MITTNRFFRKYLGFCLVWGVMGVVFGDELVAFQDYLQIQRSLIDRRFDQEVDGIRNMYVGSISNLVTRASNDGDLDRVLLLRETIARFEREIPTPVGPPLSEDPGFQHLETTWQRLFDEQRAIRAERLLQLYRGYDSALEQLQRRLTRDGEIEAAMEVQTARRAVTEDPEVAEMRALLEAREALREAAREADDPSAHETAGPPILTILQASLALHLRFDRADRMRDRTRDSSRNRNDGELLGGPEVVAEGRHGGAMRFNGRGARVRVGNDRSLQITGDQTIAFWIHPSAFDVRRNPIEKAYGGEGTITLEVDGTLNYYYGPAGQNQHPYQGFKLNEAIPLGEWTHLTVVRDLENRKLRWYVNGVKKAEADAQFPVASASERDLTIGRGYAGAFAGMLDEVMIFSVALSDQQVRRVYQAVGGR